MLVEHLPFLGITELFSVAGSSAELRQSLLALGALIIAAKLFEGVFRRLRLNAIVAYVSRLTVPYAVASGLMGKGVAEIALLDDILDRSHRHPDPSVTVRDFTERWTMPHQHDYVVVERGVLVGIVSLSTFRYLPKANWARTSLRDIVRRETPLAWPDEHVEDVLQRMTETSFSTIPVVERESEKFIGAVTREDIVELMMTEFRGEH